MTPLVVIRLLTFNHEAYIEKCLDGVLIQKTTFKFKVIIGDDNSTDNTSKICQKYQKKQPNIFVHHINSPNNIRANSKSNFEMCFNTGAKYIALLEGDDYWTDPYKLQKQVDFLERNKQYVSCFHNAVQIEEGKKDIVYLPWKEDKDISAEKIIKIGGGIFPTAALMFRNCIKEFPKYFYKVKAGDRALSLLLLNYGDFYFHKDISCAYRIHGGGVYSSIKDSYPKIFENYLSNLYLFNQFIKEAKETLKPYVKIAIGNLLYELVLLSIQKKSTKHVLKSYWLYLVNLGFLKKKDDVKHLHKMLIKYFLR